MGVFLCFFIACVLWFKRNRILADKILALWMIIFGLDLLGCNAYLLGFCEKYPHLIGITVPRSLLHGPMLYLYTVSFIRKEKNLKRTDYFHFIPAFVVFLYMFNFYFFYSPEEKLMVYNKEVSDFAVFSIVLFITSIVSSIFYCIIAYRVAEKYGRLIDINLSYGENFNLNWIKFSILGMGLIFFLVFSFVVLGTLLNYEVYVKSNYFISLFVILFICFIGFFGIRQRDVFASDLSLRSRILDSSFAPSYSKSGLKEEVAIEAHKKLIDFMNSQKPYLDPKLTLGGLSDMMKLSPNHLSQIINQYEKMNFRDFVNKYRVIEFEMRAKQNSGYSIIALAFDAGFNSKSSFNISYKKFRDITPSQYISGINID